MVTHRSHKPKVVGSNPTFATENHNKVGKIMSYGAKDGSGKGVGKNGGGRRNINKGGCSKGGVGYGKGGGKGKGKGRLG